MSETVLIERRGAVAVVAMNAPAKRNALSTEMRRTLRERVVELGVDPECRAIVLTGAGGHFCAGGDVSEMTSGAADPLFATHRLHILNDIVRSLMGGNKPVVAAVEGVAAGAGFSFAMACDTVVASSTAKFVAAFTKIGLVADCALQLTLSGRVGRSAARRIILGAEVVPAERASQIGIVDELVAEGKAVERAVEIGLAYAELPPLALAATKSMFARMPATLDEVLAMESDVQGRLAATQDHVEARAAFMERRPARFVGR